MVKPSGRVAPRRDDKTEGRILDAAHTVFVRNGTAGARMQEIADEAGVNKALLHYHFGSKAKLAEAVFRRVAAHLMIPLFEVLASELALEEKVKRVVQLELDHLSSSPYLPGYLISEIHHDPGRARQLVTSVSGKAPEEHQPRIFGTLGRQIQQRVKEGTMRPIAPEQFVVNLLALCAFPFAMRPMVMTMAGLDQRGFKRFIEQRRTLIPSFFLAGMRP